MREINIQFQEHYKHLDKLCKEMYSNGEGVSAYIQDMENIPYNDKRTIDNWESIYKQLKHMRWMRNQLAHEIDIDATFCEQSDVEWVKKFYESILQGTDPLAKIYKEKQQAQFYSTKQQNQSSRYTYYNTPEKKPRKSLWNRIVSKIKSWFS